MRSLDPHHSGNAGHICDEEQTANTQSTRETSKFPSSSLSPTCSVKMLSSGQYLRPSKAIQSACKYLQWLGNSTKTANPVATFITVTSICMGMTILSRRALFMYGILLVLLFQMSLVVEPWVEYVGSDPDIRNLHNFIKGWSRFIAQQGEHVLHSHGGPRKKKHGGR